MRGRTGVCIFEGIMDADGYEYSYIVTAQNCSIEIRHFIETDSNSLGAFQYCG